MRGFQGKRFLRLSRRHVFDYRAADFADQVRDATDGAGVDAIIEINLNANAPLYPGILKAHGMSVVYGITGVQATLPTSARHDNTAADFGPIQVFPTSGLRSFRRSARTSIVERESA